MREVDTLIIGAGVSGLTYATYAKENYLIVEKESIPGGLCRTFYQDGFIWDFAGHFFHFANSTIRKLFEGSISLDEMVQCEKKTDIEYHGKKINYPFQANIHQLPQQEFIDCLYDLFNKNESDTYDSFEKMLYGKFGKSITQKFLKPYNEKLYACNLNDLDVEAMGRFFPYVTPVDVINNMKCNSVNTYNSLFDYPKKGAQYFIDILLTNVNSYHLLLNTKVSSIDPIKKTAIANGEVIRYKKIVNTIPMNQMLQLLPPNYLMISTDELTSNKVLVFNIGFDKNALDTTIHWTYFPDKDLNFYRVGYYSNILGTDRLSIYVEIGYPSKTEIDVEQQFTETINNLRKCGIITDHKVISYNFVIIDPGYVHITKKSSRLVQIINEKFKDDNIISIGRYGTWTYCSIEDCMIQAIRAATI